MVTNYDWFVTTLSFEEGIGNMNFKEFIEALLIKHIPVCFVSDKHLQDTIEVLCDGVPFSRKEVLLLAYCIGADSNECDQLLKMQGYAPLYVKRREDAVWKFAMDRHSDSKKIFQKIFPLNVDDNVMRED